MRASKIIFLFFRAALRASKIIFLLSRAASRSTSKIVCIIFMILSSVFLSSVFFRTVSYFFSRAVLGSVFKVFLSGFIPKIIALRYDLRFSLVIVDKLYALVTNGL